MTVNENASGAWTDYCGRELVFVDAGANHLHVIVRKPNKHKTFGFPTRWLDFKEGAAAENAPSGASFATFTNPATDELTIALVGHRQRAGTNERIPKEASDGK